MRVFGLGPTELMIILAIVLLLFGPKQIPKLSRMFGKAMKDMREGLEGKDEEEEAKPSELEGADVPGQAEVKSQEDAKKDETPVS